MPGDDDIISGISSPGKFDATVESEEKALELIRQAMPDALELPQAVPGKPYPAPPKGARKWYQLHPPDAAPGSPNPNLPHAKYVDWTKGKWNKGGSWGHIYFPAP